MSKQSATTRLGAFGVSNLSAWIVTASILLLLSLSYPVTEAFTLQFSSSPPISLTKECHYTCLNNFVCLTQQRRHHHQKLSSPSLYSSIGSNNNNNNNDNDDDELSKLISKRNQIKRKKNESTESSPLLTPETTEPLVDLDLDKLPQFKTERPVRRAGNKKDQDGENSSLSSSSSSSSSSKSKDVDKNTKQADSPIVDFMADYDDENDLHIPNRLGITSRDWGDPSRQFVSSNTKLTKRMIKAGKFVPGDVQVALGNLLQSGITLIETAPTYGLASKSERLTALDLLQTSLEETPENLPEVQILASLGVSAWRKPRSMIQSLSDTCDHLNQASLEVFSVPYSRFFPKSILANALYNAIESGQANHVGIQGITSPMKLRRFCQLLEKKGITLTTNAFEFSLTKTKHERMFEACKQNNVIPIVLNPLDDGLATGVFTATNPSGGGVVTTGGSQQQQKFDFKRLEKLQPLHSVQETVADRVQTRVRRNLSNTQERFRGGKYGPPPKINTEITTTQIAIAYVIAKGGVPLVPVNNPLQADQVLGCLGWTLTDEEVEMLDSAVALCKL